MEMTLISVEAFDETDTLPTCFCCDASFKDECYFLDPDYVCVECFEILAEDVRSEAIQFAQKECKITGDMGRFDIAGRWSPTPEEYASGDKFANTENAFRTRARHEHTNYDCLIRGLNRYCALDSIRYLAIRIRIDEMIDDEIESSGRIYDSRYEDEAPSPVY